MGLIKEPPDIDLSTSSAPWTAAELVEFRALMQRLKKQNKELAELRANGLPSEKYKKKAS